MGKNNKSRRAAKARKKQRDDPRRQTRQTAHGAEGQHSHTAGRRPEELLVALVQAHRQGRERMAEVLISRLIEQDPIEVGAGVALLLESRVAELWERGWQPLDLARVVAKWHGRTEAGLLRRAIAAQAVEYRQWGAAVGLVWMAQLDEIGAGSVPDPARPWPLDCGATWDAVFVSAVVLIASLDGLVPLPQLLPPPSAWAELSARPTPVNARLEPGVLERIRALLAKAESTQFEPEAEAFTAKAQEMLSRYRIDRASLQYAHAQEGGEVVGRRVGVDDPYARAKAMLVGGIARANACRAVWTAEYGFATVHGHPEDVDGVEELYTSLLVQATSALQREGSRQDRFGRSRTARFRRSFLIGFAVRIAERLREADEETVRRAEQETGVALVPFLAARARAAEEAMKAMHGQMKNMSVSVSDGEGFEVGIRVADQADLRVGSAGELVGSPVGRLR